MNELAVPESAIADSDSFELLRVWVADSGQHVSIRTSVWEDPGAWGIMLADLARHVAEAYAQLEERDIEATLRRIREILDKEWDRPTDRPEGSI